MPRRLRVEYPGAIYHVVNRGDRREPIFRDDQDRNLFLGTMGECCGKTDWQVHAWCLMPNHFHLVVETPRANLVAGMKWFLGTYTARFNRRHKLFTAVPQHEWYLRKKSVGFRPVPCDRHGHEKETTKPKAN